MAIRALLFLVPIVATLTFCVVLALGLGPLGGLIAYSAIGQFMLMTLLGADASAELRQGPR